MSRSPDVSRTTVIANEPSAFELGDDWIVRRPGSRERRWFLLHGLIRGLFWLLPFVVVSILWIFWFEVPLSDPVPLGILVLGSLLLFLVLLRGVVYPRKWMVAIGPREVMVERGILWTTRVIVPFDRVQQVDTVSTPVSSRLDLTELELHSAAGAVRIFALDPNDAALISDRVREYQPPIPLIRQ